MNIALIGLGKMGSAIAQRLLAAGYSVYGYDPNHDSRKYAQALGVTLVERLESIAQQAQVIWLMVPAGPIVDNVIKTIEPFLTPDHIIVDGGNSHFPDSIRRHAQLLAREVSFIDCGTSGGVHGAAQGFCLMVGGDRIPIKRLEPYFHAIASKHGYAHVGPAGAGHYVKMVHNGIEYGLLQAYAEGFRILKEGSFKDVPLDLDQIALLWNDSSVIRSWILTLTHNVFKHDQTLTNVVGVINESGTGAWTQQEAYAHHIDVPVLDASLHVRKESRETGGNYATALVAMLRNQFGGHAVKRADEKS